MLSAALLAAVACLSGAASASAAAPNPASNLPLVTPPACSAPVSTACENAAVSELDSAHATLGLAAYTLPADFDSLAAADQLLILSNLDRIAYRLPPISGLSPALDNAAQVAVAKDTDPDPGADLPAGLNSVGWWSNWAGGYANALLAYYGWMYDDGPGSPNLDCASAGDSGCWGHRQDILAGSAADAMVMGAAAGADPYGEPGYALTIVGTAAASPSWTTLNYTWAQALADIGGSGSSGTAAGSGSAASASGSTGSGATGVGGSGAGGTGASGPTGAVSGSGAGASGSSGQAGPSSGRGSAGSGGSSGRGGSPTPTAPATRTPTPASVATSGAPITVIASTHVNATTHVASFVLAASGAASGFQCALVRRSGDTARAPDPRYGACGAVSVYRHLATGSYTFYARAVDSAGSARKPARRSFSIG
jgi:hypothetical protein